MNPVKKHEWKERVLIITALSPTNIGYKEQNQLLKSDKKGMKERDVLVYRMYTDHWLDPKGNPLSKEQADAIYEAYSLSRETFSVILIGKDGRIKLRNEDLVSTKELFQLIDSMPMRKQEMRQEKTPNY